jgi:hypothetical protein
VESDSASTEEIMTQKQNSDDQRADFEQSKSQRIKTATEFFREKFADEDEAGPFIDPKGDDDAQNIDVSNINSLDVDRLDSDANANGDIHQ